MLGARESVLAAIEIVRTDCLGAASLAVQWKSAAIPMSLEQRAPLPVPRFQRGSIQAQRPESLTATSCSSSARHTALALNEGV